MAKKTIRPLIEEAVIASMKNRDKETTSTLRMAISELKKEEIDKRIELGDEQVIHILQRMIKQRKDSYSQFSDAGRNELAEKEQNEINILSNFLPEQLNEEELTNMVTKGDKIGVFYDPRVDPENKNYDKKFAEANPDLQNSLTDPTRILNTVITGDPEKSAKDAAVNTGKTASSVLLATQLTGPRMLAEFFGLLDPTKEPSESKQDIKVEVSLDGERMASQLADKSSMQDMMKDVVLTHVN